MDAVIEYHDVDIHAYEDIFDKARVRHPQDDEEKAVEAGIMYPRQT